MPHRIRIAFLRAFLGPVLAASSALALAQSSRGAPAVPAPASDDLVAVFEGGVHPGGYVDGRPVPSGFVVPLLIRFKPRVAMEPGS
jgi:hypothetical protein